MNDVMTRWARCLIWTALVVGGPLARHVVTQTPAASTDSADAGWPRQLLGGTTTFSIYQPQVDSWSGNRLQVRAAVAVRDSGLDWTIIRPTIVLGANSPIGEAFGKLAGGPAVMMFGLSTILKASIMRMRMTVAATSLRTTSTPVTNRNPTT